MIEGGKKPPGVVCVFCGLEVSDRILLNWHWTASEECGAAAKVARLI